MASDPKAAPVAGPAAPKRESGVRIFTYPKIIFIFPTLIMAMICWIGMWWVNDSDLSGAKLGKSGEVHLAQVQPANAPTGEADLSSPIPSQPDPKRFRRTENAVVNTRRG